MVNFEKYRLELEEYANNLNNKRQDLKHIINEDLEFAEDNFLSVRDTLLKENSVFDAMGDYDLKNYEKWLDNE